MSQARGYQAYRAAPQSPRQVEAAVLMRVTRAMKEARDTGDRIALIRAATDNKVLWITLITDLLSEGNQLPEGLRAELVQVGQTIIKEVSDNVKGDLDVDFLIEINTAIIEGLQGRAGGDAAGPPAQAASVLPGDAV